MDAGTRTFWSIFVLLLSASVFFGVEGGRARAAVQKAGAAVQTGELVKLAS